MNKLTGGLRATGWSVVLAITLAACGGGSSDSVAIVDGGGSSGSGGTSTVAGWTLTPASDPWKATIAIDSNRSASANMELKGGTLSATGADGTVYTLSVPADALYAATRITMTPLSSVTGLPVTGPAAGVQFGPDGTQFFKPVTLTVKLPAGSVWPIDRQIPISLEGAGNVASLAALDPTSVDPKFSLMHFSSYVVLLSEKGMSATLSQADVRRRFGGNEAQRLQSAMSEALALERQKQLLGTSEGGMPDGFLQLQKEYEEKVVKLRIAQAGSSCAAAKLAMTTFLGNERQNQLLGMASTITSSAASLLDIGTEVCMKEEYEICRDEHIIPRILPILMGVYRQYALLSMGVDGSTAMPPGLAKAEEYTRKCLQFELQFDSSGTYTDADYPGFSMSERVESRVKIGYAVSLANGIGDAPPDVLRTLGLVMGQPSTLMARDYSVAYNDQCHKVSNTQAVDGQLAVTFLTWKPGDDSPQTPGGSLRLTDVGISLALTPNLSTYSLSKYGSSSSGCSSPPVNSKETESWSIRTGATLLEQLIDAQYGAYATGWQMVNSDIVATKDITINKSENNTTTRGTARMVLFHTPIR